jgi:hypothetical protein
MRCSELLTVTQASDIIRELGGVPGYEQAVGNVGNVITFSKFNPAGNPIYFAFHWGPADGIIPDDFAKRYIEAKLNVLRVKVEALEARARAS